MAGIGLWALNKQTVELDKQFLHPVHAGGIQVRSGVGNCFVDWTRSVVLDRPTLDLRVQSDSRLAPIIRILSVMENPVLGQLPNDLRDPALRKPGSSADLTDGAVGVPSDCLDDGQIADRDRQLCAFLTGLQGDLTQLASESVQADHVHLTGCYRAHPTA